MKSFKEFKSLHHGPKPLLIGNVWNAQSAKVFEKLKFDAIATSSAAVAETLGYADGEEMSFDEYRFVVNRISKSTTLPLSVDLEGGYGKDADDIVENIRTLSASGVVGINIEDSVMENKKRSIADKDQFAEKLRHICQKLAPTKTEMFINVRTDAFLLGLPDPVNEAIARARAYQATGVHGLFFPCITKPEDIKAVVAACTLPVSVMCMPGLPDFATLGHAGVKRISMGNFLNLNLYRNLENQVHTVLANGNFNSVFAPQ
jgi:2-methylisocitrate lyase-like PEP mutase family enzyme